MLLGKAIQGYLKAKSKAFFSKKKAVQREIIHKLDG